MQERLLGHRPRTADFPRCARTAAGSQYHVGVEHREKRVEAADAYASDKGDNNFTLTARIGMRGRFTTHWRGRLANCLPAAEEHATMEAISSNGAPKMSCRTKA